MVEDVRTRRCVGKGRCHASLFSILLSYGISRDVPFVAKRSYASAIFPEDINDIVRVTTMRSLNRSNLVNIEFEKFLSQL